jgi:hypothetical protein
METTEMKHLHFPDMEAVGILFGDGGRSYGRSINLIAEELANEQYQFEDNAVFIVKSLDPESGRAYAGRIYWREILFRAHMASVASIFRTTRWIDSAVNEYSSGNLFGWASACRALIESSGDIGHSLFKVAPTIAKHHRDIAVEISGKGAGPSSSSQALEDTLIHFSHARKIGNSEIDPPKSHRALQTREYVKFIEEMKVEGAVDLYAELCEIVHPAASSVAVMFVVENGKWSVNFNAEKARLNQLVASSAPVLSNVLMAAYNPPLLILRVLHNFNLFKKIAGLRKVQFDNIPVWKEIQRDLKL